MILGKRDPVLDYNSLIEQTQNATIEVVEFPDGHMSYIENYKECLAELQQFVKDCG